MQLISNLGIQELLNLRFTKSHQPQDQLKPCKPRYITPPYTNPVSPDILLYPAQTVICMIVP